jgi:hypothetical protein
MQRMSLHYHIGKSWMYRPLTISSKKQFKSRLTKWKLFKNLKGDEVVWMARKQLKRKIEENKETVFQINERQVPPEKIDQKLKRMKVKKESFIHYGSPMACEIFRHPKIELKATLMSLTQLLPRSSTTRHHVSKRIPRKGLQAQKTRFRV